MPHVDTARFTRIAASRRCERMPIDDPALWMWIVVGIMLIAPLRALIVG